VSPTYKKKEEEEEDRTRNEQSSRINKKGTNTVKFIKN